MGNSALLNPTQIALSQESTLFDSGSAKQLKMWVPEWPGSWTVAEGTTRDMGCILSGTGGGCDAQRVCVDTLISPPHPVPPGPAVTPAEDANCSFNLDGLQGWQMDLARKVWEENMFGLLQANRISQVSKRKVFVWGLSSHRFHGIQSHNSQLETFLKGEAKAGAGDGCDPQKPHCAPDPIRLWVWKHHSKRDKGISSTLLLPPKRGGPVLGETLSWDSCAEQEGRGSSKEVGKCWSLTTEGAGTEGSCWERPTWSTAWQCLSPWLWLMIQATGMDCLETDIQVAISTCPQGHPHGDPAACGKLFWVECTAWGSFLQGEKGEKASKTHLLWREW